MRCEICHTKEANVHLTHRYPAVPSLNVPATQWSDHLCEECATMYQKELDGFRQHESILSGTNMSDVEREVAIQAHREAERNHMTDWKSRSRRNDAV